MRILVVTREIPPVGGGAGTVALALSRALVRKGHEIHVVTMGLPDLPRTESIDGVAVHRLDVGRTLRDRVGLFVMARFVVAAWRAGRRLLRESDFDLIHAHAVVPDGFVARWLGRSRRIPVAITAHGSDVPGFNPDRFRYAHRLVAPVWRRVVSGTAVLVSPSEYLAGLIGAVAPEAEVEVIPNGIDTGLFPEPRSGRAGFLIVSRLARAKGHHLFLEALRQVPRRQSVDIVGEGVERTQLQEMAQRLEHDVEFHGWLEHGSPSWRELYVSSRFFVLPSRAENFSVTLLEAQVAGLVVLASDIPGNREVMGSEAMFFAELTPAAIAETIEQVLDMSDDELDRRGRHARERVSREFGWDAVADRYLERFELGREERHGAN
jgi:glycosyltransferase involved in cell wall biosynthesis